VRATARGKRILQRGRERRIDNLVALLSPLRADELRTLGRAAEIIERAVSERGPAPRE
jgi:hypothetical protein